MTATSACLGFFPLAINSSSSLSLMLLEHRLVKSVLLSPSAGSGGPRIELHKSAVDRLGRAIARRSKGQLVVDLSVAELGAWLGFF